MSDDFDPFAEQTEEEKQQAEEAAKNAPAKKVVKTKSSILLDVKPWEKEQDLDELEQKVRGLEIKGLTWGASKRFDIGYGIQAIQIMATILDEQCSSQDIEDAFEGLEDYVQSFDIAAWNKI